MSSTKPTENLRLRVFAGPNGSGKSTIIKAVRKYKQDGHLIDFGIYINADDIAVALRKNTFAFSTYQVKTSNTEFCEMALQSGLVANEFNEQQFRAAYSFEQNRIKLINPKADERLAQILADFLRKKLLAEGKRFSFETVFSHPGKLDIMRQAKEAGYKVYLYFVSTESPLINIDRVALRVSERGHDVPAPTIESRYYRSLNLLFEAAQIAYQAYFFDNSGTKPQMIAHFKVGKEGKKWDDMDENKLPAWFKEYYRK